MNKEHPAQPIVWDRHPRFRWYSLLASVLAFLLVLFTLDDPGLTVDEPLDVAPGRQYLQLLSQSGMRFWSPQVINATYVNNREHPPLGRWLLGLSSVLFEPMEAQIRGPDPSGLYVRSGRVAPAFAFGLIMLLVVRWAGKVGGPQAALGAGLSLLFMPRLFAHAHLAVLDTFVAMTWTSAFLAQVNACEVRSWKSWAGATGLTALALLTKLHGWLLFPAILIWLLVRRPGWATTLYLALAMLVAVLLFFIGWPWLWIDPVGRLGDFFRTGVARLPIRVLYFGKVYQDMEIPWHYPWFYSAVTVPIGVLLLGLVGGVRSLQTRAFDPRPMALLLAIGFWLILFSTKVPVYDGERLYLPVFPLLAILAGLGFASLWDRLRVSWARAILAGVLIIQGVGLITYHPFQLSYFNLLVGGLPGAERLGLELTYWGDAVDDRLLDRLAELAPRGATVARVPTLAPNQGIFATTRPLFRKEIIIQDQEQRNRSDWLVIDRRTAYWPEELPKFLNENPPIYLRTIHGVWLSGIWKRSDGKTSE